MYPRHALCRLLLPSVWLLVRVHISCAPPCERAKNKRYSIEWVSHALGIQISPARVWSGCVRIPVGRPDDDVGQAVPVDVPRPY